MISRKNIKLIVIIGLILTVGKLNAQILKTQTATISFFSSTPVEDIQAKSNNCIAIINTSTDEIGFQVAIKSFVFERELMQEHFNENYLESDQYPYASFKGKLLTPIDWKKDGTYEVEVKGILNIHHVAQERTIKGTITISKKSIRLMSNFDVACKDHEIKIPTLVFKKIAEVIQVKVEANFNP